MNKFNSKSALVSTGTNLSRIIFVIFVTIGISSCAGTRNPGPLIPKKVDNIKPYLEKSGLAVVAFSVTTNSASLIFAPSVKDGGARFAYRRVRTLKGRAVGDFRTAKNKVTIALVSAGKWSLSGVRMQSVGSTYSPVYPISPWRPKSGEARVFGFAVQPGDVVYLGHVHFTISPPPRSALLFKIEDRQQDVSGAIAEIIPEKAPALIQLPRRQIAQINPRY